MEHIQDDGHLKLVVDNTTTLADYQSRLNQIITELRIKQAKGVPIVPSEIFGMIIVDANNKALRDYFSAEGIMSKFAFDRQVARMKNDQRIREAIGFVPRTGLELVSEYAKQRKITVCLNGTLRSDLPVLVEGQEITAADRARDRDIDFYARMHQDEHPNIEDFSRQLRILRNDNGLGFVDTQIANSVAEWREKARAERKRELMLEVRYDRTKVRKAAPEWEKLEGAAFNVNKPGFAVAMLKKYIWQVKRKMLGLPVTNHLMVVITGKQGGGKSTFVNLLNGPIEDGVETTNFTAIADEKIIDIWGNFVLFFDEMSGANKADMTVIKNLITARSVPRRPMRTNHVVDVRQCATFIGCSNNTLCELIRDDTGIRRFVELDFKRIADCDVVNSINWLSLWQSVDEIGADPTDPFIDDLLAQQASNRDRSSVEIWAEIHQLDYTSYTTSKALHEAFRTWEKDAFPRNETSMTQFTRIIKRLIKDDPSFNWSIKSTKVSGYEAFRFIG